MALTPEQEATCARAVDVYGKEEQWGMVQEECSELAAAVNRLKRGRFDDNDLASEIADAIIVTEQARLMVGTELVNRFVRMKLKRLESRMDRQDGK